MKLNIWFYLVCACTGLEFLFNTRGIQEGWVLYYFTSLSREVNEPIETCGILFGDWASDVWTHICLPQQASLTSRFSRGENPSSMITRKESRCDLGVVVNNDTVFVLYTNLIKGVVTLIFTKKLDCSLAHSPCANNWSRRAAMLPRTFFRASCTKRDCV